MQFRFIVLLGALSLLCFQLSCGDGGGNPASDAEQNSNPNDITGTGFLQAKIDGTNWETTSVGFVFQNIVFQNLPIDDLAIIGSDETNIVSPAFFNFRLVKQNLEPGDFELTSATKVLSGDGVAGGELFLSSGLNYEFVLGRFTLSTLSKNRVKGSFEGVLSDKAGNSINVTEGMFAITLPD